MCLFTNFSCLEILVIKSTTLSSEIDFSQKALILSIIIAKNVIQKIDKTLKIVNFPHSSNLNASRYVESHVA